tara:strand:- start:2049 stop:2456 length:408 start_codon:yes stop_codon:yes gene_type:complete
MKLTENFSLDEFIKSRFYGENQECVNEIFEDNREQLLPNIQELANNLQVIRDYCGSPISINIAFRPVWWEIRQGRSGNSQHCLGKAADIVIQGYTPTETYVLIEKLIGEGLIKDGGLGKYNTFTHIDVRGKHARW